MSLKTQYLNVKQDPMLASVLKAITDSGLTDAQVCRKTGISRTCLANWRKGITRKPQHITMAFVLRALGKKFTIDWIGSNR